MGEKAVISIFITAVILMSSYAFIHNNSFVSGQDAVSKVHAVFLSNTTNFTLTFNENGLKPGILWAIIIYSNGSYKSYSAMPQGDGYPSRNISINLPQGQYNFSVGMLINEYPDASIATG